jgi:SAM-dependent methyltransferase
MDRAVTAVEPSEVMIAQRPAGRAPAVRAFAENLPFSDASFDASMAVLTLQHWHDIGEGIAEMMRVARYRTVLVTFDPEVARQQWIAREYLPEALTYQLPAYPTIDQLGRLLPAANVEPILVPRDCTDRMFLTLWGRPEEHLDPHIRAATSTWSVVPPAAAARAVERLRHDLASWAWDARHHDLRHLPELDVGLRLVHTAL